MSLQEKIIRLIEPLVQSVEKEIATTSAILLDLNNEKDLLVSELETVHNKVLSVREEIDTIKQNRDEVENQTKSLTDKKNLFDKEVFVYRSGEEARVNKIKELNRQISNLEESLKSLHELLEQRNIAIAELTQIGIKVTDLKKEKHQLLIDVYSIKEEKEKQQAEQINVHQDILDMIEAEKLSLILREAKLAKGLKDIETKENDIKIVEARWRKLYGDKGAGFRI